MCLPCVISSCLVLGEMSALMLPSILYFWQLGQNVGPMHGIRDPTFDSWAIVLIWYTHYWERLCEFSDWSFWYTVLKPQPLSDVLYSTVINNRRPSLHLLTSEPQTLACMEWNSFTLASASDSAALFFSWAFNTPAGVWWSLLLSKLSLSATVPSTEKVGGNCKWQMALTFLMDLYDLALLLSQTWYQFFSWTLDLDCFHKQKLLAQLSSVLSEFLQVCARKGRHLL